LSLVKFVYRAIISWHPTFGLVLKARRKHRSFRAPKVFGETQGMNLGFFTMPIHSLGKDWRLSLKEDREAFLLAEELGFTEAYVGEHITDRAENITSCVAFLAWIAAATKRMKLGTGTVNMRTQRPLRLRSRCSTTCSTVV
jgi:hypothetical protein